LRIATEAEITTAIWGLESSYGERRGVCRFFGHLDAGPRQGARAALRLALVAALRILHLAYLPILSLR